MRRYVAAAATAALLGAFAFPAAGLARGDKTEVCHRSHLAPSDAPAWLLLSVGAKAAKAHLAHGDGVPGGPVPGIAGQTFDASCGAPRADSGSTTTTTLGTTTTTTLGTTTTTTLGTTTTTTLGTTTTTTLGTTTTTTLGTTTTTTLGTTTTTTLGSSTCLDGLLGSFDLSVTAINVDDGATLWRSTNGTCTGDIVGLVTVVDGAADRTDAGAACALVLGRLPTYYFPLRLEPIFPDAPADWWLCV